MVNRKIINLRIINMDYINISYDFIDKYVRFAKPEYLQVYLYAKYRAEKDGAFPSAEDVAAALDIKPARVEFIFEYWASRGEIAATDDGYEIIGEDFAIENKPEKKQQRSTIQKIRSTRPSYSQDEINAVASASKQVSGLFYQAETILNKVLTASEMEMLFSFNDWLGLPVEVILMLLSYAQRKGKTSKRYLETVAIDWAERGIVTFEAAEEYVTQLEAADSTERQIRSILGIYDRALTQTEKKYIKIWIEEFNSPTELISLAYDRTVLNTGKMSPGYMNKMLEDWHNKGITTVDGVKELDEEFYRTSGAKSYDKKPSVKSKFNNYEDGNERDYSDLDEKILDMMLEG